MTLLLNMFSYYLTGAAITWRIGSVRRRTSARTRYVAATS